MGLNKTPYFGQTVYDKLNGEGNIVGHDELGYEIVDFSNGEKCVHSSQLFFNPEEEFVSEENDAVKSFHAGRKMIVFRGERIFYKDNTTQSHADWFTFRGWISNSGDERFEDIIRGYIDDTGVYFYKGVDFKTDEQMELFIKDRLHMISRFVRQFSYQPIKVYCGVKKGEVGQKYAPISYIGCV